VQSAVNPLTKLIATTLLLLAATALPLPTQAGMCLDGTDDQVGCAFHCTAGQYSNVFITSYVPDSTVHAELACPASEAECSNLMVCGDNGELSEEGEGACVGATNIGHATVMCSAGREPESIVPAVWTMATRGECDDEVLSRTDLTFVTVIQVVVDRVGSGEAFNWSPLTGCVRAVVRCQANEMTGGVPIGRRCSVGAVGVIEPKP
jgi:hypothetical protein